MYNLTAKVQNVRRNTKNIGVFSVLFCKRLLVIFGFLYFCSVKIIKMFGELT